MVAASTVTPGLKWRMTTESFRDAPVPNIFISALVMRVFLGLLVDPNSGMAVQFIHNSSSPTFPSP